MLINELKAYSIMINASKKDRQKSKRKKVWLDWMQEAEAGRLIRFDVNGSQRGQTNITYK